MKLATFRPGGGAPRIGAVHDGDRKLLDLTEAADGDTRFSSMLALIDGGEAALAKARDLLTANAANTALNHAIAEIELLSPLPEPRQMRDGMSYETHIRQSGRGMRHLMSGGDMSSVGEQDLPPLGAVYSQLPIYYICLLYTSPSPRDS